MLIPLSPQACVRQPKLAICVLLVTVNVLMWVTISPPTLMSESGMLQRLVGQRLGDDSILREKEVEKVCALSEAASFAMIKDLDPMDGLVLGHIRCFHLFPPSKDRVEGTGSFSEDQGLRQWIKDTFKDKRNGIFIECGANDGEFLSNTLRLEREFGWTGLLIEAHPKYGQILRTKKRHAWFADVCLSPKNTITDMEFWENLGEDYEWKKGMGKLQMGNENITEPGFTLYGKVRCFPLASIMAALDVRTVDLFSLDVEGVEYNILKTLPFNDSLKIKTFIVEVTHVPEGEAAVRSWMSQHGYSVKFQSGSDIMFVSDEHPVAEKR